MKQESPECVSEGAMFAHDDAPFVLPVAAPRSGPLQPMPSGRSAVVEAGQTGEPSVGRPLRKLLRQWPGAMPPPEARMMLVSRFASTHAVGSALSTELDRGTGFILAPVFMALGVIVYSILPWEPAGLSLAIGTAFFALCTIQTRAKPILNMVLGALLLAMTGALLAKIETSRTATKMLGSEVTTRLSGTISEVERMASGRVRLTIDVTGTERPELRYAPERVRISARSLPEGVTAGAAITGLVRLMPPSGPVRPGSYDFSYKSYFNGIGASGFFLRGPEPGEAAGAASTADMVRARVERLRYAIAERISDHIGGAEGEIAAALVVGVRAGIPEEVNEAMRRSGIYHVISISGLHMALVAGTVMLLLRTGFALFPDFSSRRPVKKYAAALALLGLTGYLLISGAEVAAQRSYLMLVVMLVAVLFDRAALTMRNLAVAAVIVIAISPHEVLGPSFQMSFAATAALVGAYAWWSERRLSKPGTPPSRRSVAGMTFRYLLLSAGGIAATSFVAGGATAIYAAWHFQQMPALSVFTNLVAMPVVSTVVMPFGVLGALAMPFGLDGPFFHVMGLGLTATIAISHWFSERSPSDIVGLVPTLAVGLLTISLVIATACTTWLRAAAIPVALAGLLLLFIRHEPDLLVSEDARLVGLAIGEGRIAVNRARPNGFTIENWKRALRTEEVVKPDGRQTRDNEKQDATRADVARLKIAELASGRTPDGLSGTSGAGFVCAGPLCLARHPTGAIVAHVLDVRTARGVCDIANVIIVDDATAGDACSRNDVLVISSRELARWGSASIRLSGNGRAGSPSATIEYAIREPYRPWHEQRRFSRAARGLAPYEYKANPASRSSDRAASGNTSSEFPPVSGGRVSTASQSAERSETDHGQ